MSFEEIGKKDVILATMASQGKALFTPAQIQKIPFILDKKLFSEEGSEKFSHEPYHYGPFDKEIYEILDDLEEAGCVEETSKGESSPRNYHLTKYGLNKGKSILRDLDEDDRDYIKKVTSFVTDLSFQDLITTIYDEWPKMTKNSKLQQA